MRTSIIKFVVYFFLSSFPAVSLGESNIPQVESKTYKIDTSRSELIIIIQKEGIASALGHNHVIRAEQFNGTIIFDEDVLSGSSVNIVVNTESLKADLPEMRKKYKLKGELSRDDISQIEKDMKSDIQLNTKNFPVIKFSSETLTREDKNNYLIFGNLTIHGVTKRIFTHVKIEIKNKILIAHSSFKIKQSDFKIKPFSTAFGMIKNEDDVLIIFNFSANKINS